ncbi:MAG: periplasmic heavy metal sensor [Bacteroidota bacterium]
MKKMIWLVVLAATTTMAVAQPHQRRGEPQRQRGDRQERFIERLELTDAQQEAIEALRVDHMKSTKGDRDALRLKMVQLESEATNESPNTAEIDQLTTEIGGLQTQLLKARVSHQIEIRAQLDDDQKMKFDQLHRKRREGRGRF